MPCDGATLHTDMSLSQTTIATRALNELRVLFAPSYLALRCMLESAVVRQQTDSSLFAAIIEKTSQPSGARFIRFERFKKRTRQGKFESRSFASTTPTMAIAEAHFLGVLADDPNFAVHPRVYSYFWPHRSNSGRSFQFFLQGYAQRNRDVCGCLAHSPDSVVIVSDIEKFYPSINRERVTQRFLSACTTSRLSTSIQTLARALIDQLLAPEVSDAGLPIGPALSHVLANFALQELDVEMSERFGLSYSRYVDDIVLVVPRADRFAAQAILESALEREGLRASQEKTDVVESQVWLARAPMAGSQMRSRSFEELRDRLIAFLAVKPDHAEELSRRFESEHFSLPLSRLRLAATSGALRRWLRVLHRRGASVLWQAWRDTVPNLITFASYCREELLNRMDACLHEDASDRPTLRRWQIQELRYCVSRLFYLLPSDRYQWLGQQLQNHPEMVEMSALLAAVANNSAEPLLQVPGLAVQAFASRTVELGTPCARIETIPEPSEAVVSSLATLLAYGACEISGSVLERVSKSQRLLLNHCRGQRQQLYSGGRINATDEIFTLQLGITGDEKRQLLLSRFSDEEIMPLEALFLGTGYYE